MENTKKKHSFLHGAMILTGGMIVVKLIGAMFKIPLNYTIGEYGMGLFHAAYHFYGPIFSLATAGFPVAVSRMVAESHSTGHWHDVRQIRRVALPLLFTVGVVGTFLLTLAAPWYCRFSVGDAGWRYALPPLLALTPAILFACVSAVYRGYFEGLQQMTPTALSEVIEALGKLTLGLLFSRYAVARGTAEYAAAGTVFSIVPPDADHAALLTLSFAAAGAVLGVTAGSGLALLFLFLRAQFAKHPVMQGNAPASPKKVLRCRFIRLTIPIALGSLATNVAGLMDAALLQNRLTALCESALPQLIACWQGAIPQTYLEHPETLSTFLYGCYTLAMTLYLLVPALAQSIGISALPAVTEDFSRKNANRLAQHCGAVCRVTALVCFPAGLGLSSLALPIVRLIYGDSQSAPIVAGVLQLLGVAALASALTAPLGSLLQAVGRADLPVKLLAVSMLLKLLCNWFLCRLPGVNLYGAAVGTLVCYLFLSLAEFHALRRCCTGLPGVTHLFAKPLFCAVGCAVSAQLVHRAMQSVFGDTPLILAISIVCAAAVYLLLLLLTGTLQKNDVNLLPGGQKITKMLEKWS